MSKSFFVILLGFIIMSIVVYLWDDKISSPREDEHGYSIISEENLQEPSPKDTDYQRSLKIINLEKRIKELEELLSKLVILKQDPYVVDTNTILITNLKEVQFLSRY